jgi:sulfoxide reductase heme-binding subunit YedZ
MTNVVALGGGPSLLWFLTRGTGTAALLALGFTVALGVANKGAFSRFGLTAFAVDELHRYTAAVALLLLGTHILTAILDPFAGIGPLAAVVPGTTAYRPLWVGLGAVAFDLLLVVYLSSKVRLRLPYRLWRGLHWLAWPLYPLALLHAFGTGSDSRFGWFIIAALFSVGLVGAAALQRLLTSALSPTARYTALAALAAGGLVFGLWLIQGPLAPNWAKRAGTPQALLARSSR